MKKIDLSQANIEPFEKIGKEWMLITAGNSEDCNTMTASWGFMGVIWGKDAAEVVVRHSRYTYEFMEREGLFTLSFFREKYREVLSYCGSMSGRDTDKIADMKLTPVDIDGTVGFKEAYLTLVCRKMYAADIDTSCLAEGEQHFYDNDALHKMYIGEIISVYTGEE